MRYEEFEATARRMWREIPPEYKEGVDALVVERRARPDPSLPDIYTMGDCRTDSFPSSFGGPETLRSTLVLYYGSFLRLAALEPEFGWEEEIWETLTHELRHHLESLAAEDALEDVDYAADENFKRLSGESYDPYFFRAGEVVEEGVYAVEGDVFIEVEQHPGEDGQVEFEVGRARYRVPAPQGEADVWFIHLLSGLNARREAYVVLTRRRGMLDTLRALVAPARLRVREAEGRAERMGSA